MFSGPFTMSQLISSGVLGTVKIRKAGYPIRIALLSFAVQYKAIVTLDALLFQASLNGQVSKELRAHCKAVLDAAGLDQPRRAQIGRTLVFMKSDAYPAIEKRRMNALRTFVMDLQRVGRAMRFRRKCWKAKNATLVQRCGRGMHARLEAFNYFCEKHREEHLRQKRLREEAARRLKDVQRKLDEEGINRVRVLTAEGDAWAALLLSANEGKEMVERAIRRREAEAARIAEMRRRQAEETERQRQRAIEARRRFESSLLPMLASWKAQYDDTGKMQFEMFQLLRFAEWKDRLRVVTEMCLKSIVEQEGAKRRAIIAEYNAGGAALEGEYAVVREALDKFRILRQLEHSLMVSRRERSNRARARDAKADGMRRAPMELILEEASRMDPNDVDNFLRQKLHEAAGDAAPPPPA